MVIRDQMDHARSVIEDVVRGTSPGAALIGPGLGKSALLFDVLRSLKPQATMLGGGTPRGFQMHMEATDAPIVVWEFWRMQSDVRILRMVLDHLESGKHRYIITERFVPKLGELPPHRRELFQRILDRLMIVRLSEDWVEAVRYVEWLAAERGIISSMIPDVGIDEADAILEEFHKLSPWLDGSLFDLSHIARDFHWNRKDYYEFYRPMRCRGEPKHNFDSLPPRPTVTAIGAAPKVGYAWADRHFEPSEPPKRSRPRPLVNYWGKSPWNAFVAMAAERMSEVDVYHAGHARAVLEQAEQDGVRVGWGGCGGDLDMMEFSGKNGGQGFILDISETARTIHIRGIRAKIRRVEERAPAWLLGHYPLQDGTIPPRATSTMDLIIDRSMYWEGNPDGREAVRDYLTGEGIIIPRPV